PAARRGQRDHAHEQRPRARRADRRLDDRGPRVFRARPGPDARGSGRRALGEGGGHGPPGPVPRIRRAAARRARPGRHRRVDRAALDLLDGSRLRGAALDVFATEPLPPGHRCWRHPRVLVSLHVAAVTARFWERETGLIVDNITRYLAGSPLTNTVDAEAGY